MLKIAISCNKHYAIVFITYKLYFRYMRKTPLIILLAIICHVAIAQKYIPKIGNNSIINYNVEATAVGQKIQLMLTVTSVTDPVTLGWSIPGLGTGSYQMSAKGLESGTKMKLKEPGYGVTKLKDDETLLVLSKSTFSDLTKNQAFELNNGKFTVKTDETVYKINDKDADVIHAVSANGKVDIWILNNADFPLVCKLTGFGGFDIDLASIKE